MLIVYVKNSMIYAKSFPAGNIYIINVKRTHPECNLEF